jgi:hypothetical protein
MLGRVRGRSPLEYLNAEERTRQADAVAALMADPPATVAELADRFVTAIANSRQGDHTGSPLRIDCG